MVEGGGLHKIFNARFLFSFLTVAMGFCNLFFCRGPDLKRLAKSDMLGISTFCGKRRK